MSSRFWLKSAVAVGIALALSASAIPASADTVNHRKPPKPVECRASVRLHYGALIGGTFSVQSTVIRKATAVQDATPGGLRETFVGQGDLDVIDYNATTVGQLVKHPIKYSGTGVSLNLWIDANHNDRYFDLPDSDNGTFHALAGDDYVAYNPTAGTVNVLGNGSGKLTKGSYSVADFAKLYPGNTEVAVDAVLEGNGGKVSGNLRSLNGIQTTYCHEREDD